MATARRTFISYSTLSIPLKLTCRLQLATALHAAFRIVGWKFVAAVQHSTAQHSSLFPVVVVVAVIIGAYENFVYECILCGHAVKLNFWRGFAGNDSEYGS